MTASADNSATLTLPARMLGGLASAVSASPRLTLWLGLSLACAAVGITVADLTVKTSRADLVDPATEFAQSWKEYSTTFGATSDLIAVVETPVPNPRLIQSVLSELGKRLEHEKELFSGVLYRIDQQSLRRKGLPASFARELSDLGWDLSKLQLNSGSTRCDWALIEGADSKKVL